MSDRAGSAATPRGQNRANWVGLRTLRQVPRLVDRTAGGEPIYEVRSVRLVLPRDARHFARLVACSKCGREVPGPVVLTPADLDNAAHRVICKDCVRAATVPMFDRARSRGPVGGTDPPAPPETPQEEDRLAAVESQARALAAEVAAQRSEWQGALDRQAEAREERDRSVDRAIERLDRAPQVDAGRVEALERRLDEAVARLEADADAARGLDRDRHDRALDAAVSAIRDQLARIELQVVDRFERRTERAARMATSGRERLDALESRVREALGRLASTVDEHAIRLQEMRSAIASTEDGAARRMAAMEQLVAQRAAELADLAEVQATLDGGLGELRSQIAEVGEATRLLAAHQEELDGRVAQRADPHPASPPVWRGLGRRAAEADAQMAAVSAAADDLVRERQQLNARLDEIEVAADHATAASARATARASELAPLRADMRALREELLEHHEALEALRKSVDRLRRKAAAPPAEAKPTKPAKLAKRATPAKRPTKR